MWCESMFICPNCGEKTISLWTKLAISPGILSVKCGACGKDVCGVFGDGLFCWIPLILGCIVTRYVTGFAATALVFFGGAFASVIWACLSSSLLTRDEYVATRRGGSRHTSTK